MALETSLSLVLLSAVQVLLRTLFEKPWIRELAMCEGKLFWDMIFLSFSPLIRPAQPSPFGFLSHRLAQNFTTLKIF